MDLVDPASIHPDFERVLSDKPVPQQFLYRDVRSMVLGVYPDSNELLYHTHALSSVYSVSRQLKHAFCHIAVYGQHLNLGFNSGTELNDPAGLLTGTGSRIRHVPVDSPSVLENADLVALIEQAVAHALDKLGGPATDKNHLISKVKTG
ncbi:MAG: DUF1801 domain-containing protein [Parvularculaceae bacterium]